ncbi:MAG TPA: FAD-linked oxidase C-terminal domain-containing protein [Limnochordia bacterium]
MILAELSRIVGERYVLRGEAERLVYETDAFTLERVRPQAVVLPGSPQEVQAVVTALARAGIPFVPRGAGTSLSGGALAWSEGVIIGLARLRRILEVDLRNRRAVVETGLVNLKLTRAVEGRGYLFAPDPSSQGACTIGGNVAENSGGPHTLKYGVTVNHVLGVHVVLPDGQDVWLGSKLDELPGYDLVGLFVGSEGTFGIATEAVVRLIRQPQAWRTMLAIFDSVEAATQTVSDIIAAGILPAALEMMDRMIIEAVEAAFGFGFPPDAAAVLIIELDGVEAGLDAQAAAVRQVCERRGAREVRLAGTEAERNRLWASRKRAFGAVGRLSPSYVTQDGVIPRTRLPEVLRTIAAIGERYGLRIANVFHAGDGNLHPILLFDERDADETRRVLSASEEILRACVAVGGSVTGEHGIGVEKIQHLPLMFSPEDLSVMLALRSVFDPHSQCNPGKVFPTTKTCYEIARPRPRAAL